MKSIIASVMMLLLVGMSALPQPVNAVIGSSVSNETPCPMHSGMMDKMADSDDGLPCDDCESHLSACQGSTCGCCFPVMLLMSGSNPLPKISRLPLVRLQVRYSSVWHAPDSPPPRFLSA